MPLIRSLMLPSGPTELARLICLVDEFKSAHFAWDDPR